MSELETIYKLQPHRTMQLQGFDGYGATAALHSASDTGFTVSGVWGGQDDFAVLQLWDINNQYEHPRMRYLPDGDFSGLVLSFDLQTINCERLDSTDYPTLDWPYLNVLVGDGTAQYATEYQVPLLTYATPAGGSYASATVSFQLTGGITAGDQVQLAWGGGTYYSYTVLSTDTLATAAAGLAAVITAGGGAVAATAAAGTVTLTYDATAGANANRVGVYGTVFGTSPTESWLPVSGQFAGGASPNVWAVSLDFTGAGMRDKTGALVPTRNIQKMWLTFVPPMPMTGWLDVIGWFAVYTSWTVTDSTGCRALKVAGPGSVRIEENSPWVVRTGFWDNPALGLMPDGVTADGWGTVSAWWSRGWAIRSAYSEWEARALTVETHCGAAHTIYLGTRLDPSGGIVDVSVDGGMPLAVDCYGSGVQARIKIADVLAGAHSVTVTPSASKNASSGGWFFYFDFLECAVLSDVPAPLAADTTVGPATDYDTDASYKLSPERLVWNLLGLGLAGEIDHYMGVFWWPVRKALEPASTWSQSTEIAFAGTPVFGDNTSIMMGTAELDHANLHGDTPETVALALAMLVNQLSTVFWAEASGAVLTLHGRASSAAYFVPVTVDTHEASAFTATATTTNGTPPAIAAGWYWGVDEAAGVVGAPINAAAVAWHAGYFAEIEAAGLGVVVSFSQELVNPPDNPPDAVWTQRFHDGTAVETATGFGVLLSSQCSFSAGVQAYMASAYCQMAGLMTAAGLPVRLQCGEILWWYQAGGTPASMAFYDADTTAAFGGTLHTFSTPNDNPNVNAFADANFLRSRLEAYVDGVRATVLAAYPGALFELLWPMDVNDPTTARLMRYVNLPLAWCTRSGSGFDTFLAEGFDYAGTEHDVDKAQACAAYPFATLAWDQAHCRYLLGLYSAGWPWQREYVAARSTRVPLAKIWAYDHVCLMNWPLPMPTAEQMSWSAIR